MLKFKLTSQKHGYPRFDFVKSEKVTRLFMDFKKINLKKKNSFTNVGDGVGISV